MKTAHGGIATTSAALIGIGGVAITATLAIDYMTSFWAYVGVQGIGFLLILIGSVLTRAFLPRGWVWALMIAAASGWLLCWSWFLTFGPLIPIPLQFWAGASSVAFLVVTFLLGRSARPVLAAGAGLLAVGSVVSTGVMMANSIIPSDFNYVPFGIGAIAGGAVLGILARRDPHSGGTRVSAGPGRPSDRVH